MDLRSFLEDYMNRMGAILKKSPLDKITRAAEILMQARKNDHWIFVAGNGGSAATASHLTNDFVKGLAVKGKQRFRVLALNDNIPLLTALSNDYGYDSCFVEQIKNYAKAGDVFFAITCSGNSENIVRAAEYAKNLGIKVIAFTGRDGGKIDPFCDVNCIAMTDTMEEIEDTHLVWEHALVCGLRQSILAE